MNPSPRLSVVMPVFNNGPHLREAVESILTQEFRDFEFIILDDGSSDGSVETLRQFAASDPRIRLFEGETNLGLVGSSNFIVANAVAPLVARMDADDVAHPQRLAIQVALFERHPELVLLGTLATTIDAAGRVVRPPDYGRLFRKSPFAPFAHSSIMFRKQAFELAGGYRREAEKWEDVDLFLRLARVGQAMVVARPLLEYRNWGGSSRSVHGQERLEEAMDLMHRYLAGYSLDQPADPSAGGAGARISPEAFITCGSPTLWEGRRPGLLRRFWRRAALGFDLASVKAMIWVTWADISPRSLRMALGLLLRIRNAFARRRLRGRNAIEWRPGLAGRGAG